MATVRTWISRLMVLSTSSGWSKLGRMPGGGDSAAMAATVSLAERKERMCMAA